MKKNSVSRILYLLIIVLWVQITMTAYAQESSASNLNKNVFVELGGSGVAVLTANFDMRFNKGSNDGLGMRLGVGGESSRFDYLIGEGEVKTKLFTVPLEVNYILGERRFSFEIGYSFTFVSVSRDSDLQFLGYHSEKYESGNVIVSYIPIGFRLKPKNNGLMFKLNVGPLWNYSAPNVFDYESVLFWGGFAVGYSFY